TGWPTPSWRSPAAVRRRRPPCLPKRRSLPRAARRRPRRRRRRKAMLELMLCALFTVLPDYLYRRYAQGKRFGHEINLYSVWFELRWGITACLILTILLITTIFYFHP